MNMYMTRNWMMEIPICLNRCYLISYPWSQYCFVLPLNCNTKCSQGIHQGVSESGVRFVSGIIWKSKALAFERMLFRSTRGNMFFNQAPAGEPVTDPISGEEVCHCGLLLLILCILSSRLKLFTGCGSFSLFSIFNRVYSPNLDV